MASGFVKRFRDASGYDFIVPEGAGKDLFVQRGSIVGAWRKPPLAEQVELEPRQGGISGPATDALPLRWSSAR